jgi:hypothetical protein
MDEFFEAWGNYRSDVERQSREQRIHCPLLALIGIDEFQLAIPWRVGLHQSPPSLHQPHTFSCKRVKL